MKDESSNRRVLVIQGTVNLDICDQFSLGCSWGCNFHWKQDIGEEIECMIQRSCHNYRVGLTYLETYAQIYVFTNNSDLGVDWCYILYQQYFDSWKVYSGMV